MEATDHEITVLWSLHNIVSRQQMAIRPATSWLDTLASCRRKRCNLLARKLHNHPGVRDQSWDRASSGIVRLPVSSDLHRAVQAARLLQLL